MIETAQKAKVFQYGSPATTMAEGVALEQLRLQNQFWNALVEIHHEFSQRYHDLRDGFDEKIKCLTEKDKELGERIAALTQQMKDKRKAARSGKAPVDGLREERMALIAERKPLREELKQYREEIKIQIKPQMHELDAEHKARVKALRQEYAGKGLYWGNYNAVVDSYQTARSRAMKEGAQLRFHRFDGSGRWTCQIQGGMTVDQAFFGSDNRFQIAPVCPGAWMHPSRSKRRRLCRTKARIRIGSNEERQPEWLEIPIIMHRPIPEDALIKSVSISAKKVGNRVKWFLNVTVVTNGELSAVDRTGKVVALDVGWRRTKDGLRVGYWVDSDDQEGEILLDKSFLETDERLTKLQQTRDNNFNLAKGKLSQWLGKAEDLPDWFLESVKHLAQWRACAKLASLVLNWRENRIAGDQEIFDFLENWRRQDKHLWTWQANLREKMQGRRLDQYRVLASELVKKYDIIAMEEFDLRQVTRKKAEGDKDRKIRSVARVAAVSSLRDEIVRACSESGKFFQKFDPANTTMQCPFCGGRIEGSPRENITVVCGKCKAVYDQDWAGAKNILKKWFGAPGPAVSEPQAAPKPRRFRRRQMANQTA